MLVQQGAVGLFDTEGDIGKDLPGIRSQVHYPGGKLVLGGRTKSRDRLHIEITGIVGGIDQHEIAVRIARMVRIEIHPGVVKAVASTMRNSIIAIPGTLIRYIAQIGDADARGGP